MGYFLVWAYFINYVWESHISSSVMSIKKFPDMTYFMNRNYRLWMNKQIIEPHRETLKFSIDDGILYGQTINRRVYDEKEDSIPWTNSTEMVEKMARKKLIIFSFMSRSLQSPVWGTTNLVNNNIVCKTILHNSLNKKELESSVRMWGSDFAASIFMRWTESGFVQHGMHMFNRRNDMLRETSVQPVEGFLQQVAMPFKSAIGIGCLGVVILEVILLAVWLIYREIVNPCSILKTSVVLIETAEKIFKKRIHKTNKKVNWKQWFYSFRQRGTKLCC